MTKFLIVVTGWNCQQYVKSCIESIAAQTYRNFKVVIVNDGSSDNTLPEIFKNIHLLKELDVVLATSKHNVGTVCARDRVIKAFDDYDVVAWLDMDDCLVCNALEKVAQAYHNRPETWLTYGNYVDIEWRSFFDEKTIQFPDEVHKNRSYRTDQWRFVHLRTFRKELYMKLSKEDLYPEYRTIYPDANMLYCLLEMAGEQHISAIPELIYRYTHNNPLNVLNRYTEAERNKELSFIQQLKPKQQLPSL